MKMSTVRKAIYVLASFIFTIVLLNTQADAKAADELEEIQQSAPFPIEIMTISTGNYEDLEDEETFLQMLIENPQPFQISFKIVAETTEYYSEDYEIVSTITKYYEDSEIVSTITEYYEDSKIVSTTAVYYEDFEVLNEENLEIINEENSDTHTISQSINTLAASPLTHTLTVIIDDDTYGITVGTLKIITNWTYSDGNSANFVSSSVSVSGVHTGYAFYEIGKTTVMNTNLSVTHTVSTKITRADGTAMISFWPTTCTIYGETYNW